MNSQPTPAALRAAASVFDRFFNVPAKATPEELALLIDAELAQERERARELEAMLWRCDYVIRELRKAHGKTWGAAELFQADGVAADAAALLTRIRSDREGSK